MEPGMAPGAGKSWKYLAWGFWDVCSIFVARHVVGPPMDPLAQIKVEPAQHPVNAPNALALRHCVSPLVDRQVLHPQDPKTTIP
jgi:hypothetical protein